MRFYTIIYTSRQTGIYRIRSTRNAITSDCIRVVPKGSRDIAIRYVEFEDVDENTIDEDYYVNVIKESLRSVCKCIGLPDENLITLMGN
jgi:hypothetical protein